MMDKEDQLTTLDLIKAEALKFERRVKEKQSTFTNGYGTSRVLNTNQINQISNNTQSKDEVDTIGRGNFNSNRKQTSRGLQNNRGNGLKCTFCKKLLTGKNMVDQTNMHIENKNNVTAKKKCKYCGRTKHKTDKCLKLQRYVKKHEKSEK